MLDLETALALARPLFEEQLAGYSGDLRMVAATAHQHGWAFHYIDVSFLAAGEEVFASGNVPIAVRHGGEAQFLQPDQRPSATLGPPVSEMLA